MTRQIILHPSSANRRQPLLSNQSSTGSMRFAEVAGGTTAECAAICCCCPCGLVNLIVLAVYKLPAGLCRRAWRSKKRRQRLKNEQKHYGCRCGCDNTEIQIHPMSSSVVEISQKSDKLLDKEVMDLEKEMWEKFYGTGFWRSPSQREDIINSKSQ